MGLMCYYYFCVFVSFFSISEFVSFFKVEFCRFVSTIRWPLDGVRDSSRGSRKSEISEKKVSTRIRRCGSKAGSTKEIAREKASRGRKCGKEEGAWKGEGVK